MGTKTDVMVKVVLVFFISLLSFSIGTFVGKKFSDNQHQIAQLEGGNKSNSESHRSIASESPSHKEPTNSKKENLTDDEIAKLAEEFVDDPDLEKDPKEEEPSQAQNQEKTHEVAKKEDHDKKDHSSSPSINKKDHASNPSINEVSPSESVSKHPTHKKNDSHPVAAVEKHEAKKESRVPGSLPKNPIQYSVGKFTVQVASYSTEDEAIKMASQLKKKGLEAYYIPATVNGKSWYRVSVGQFATVNEAKDFRKEILQKNEIKSAIVLKITK